MKYRPHLTTKPPTKKQRDALKAKERSRRNTEARKAREDNAQARRRVRRAHTRPLRKVGAAFGKIGVAATAAGKSVVEFATKYEEVASKRRAELEGMLKDDLKDIAREQGIRRFSMMTKAELVDAIILSEQSR